MSTTSPNFNLILATAADTVSVDSHVSGPLSTIDSLLSIAHTGTGQLKASLAVTSWTLTNPVFVGTATGGTFIATTGSFQTITATGGALTVTSLTVGSYAIPASIGTTGQYLVVTSGPALAWGAAPGTGAATDLSNLASVAIATSLNNFTASQVTFDQIVATAGTLTTFGLIGVTAATISSALIASGIVTNNFVVTGTVNAGAIVATAGTQTLQLLNVTAATATQMTVATAILNEANITALNVGTYAYPATVGSTNQILSVTTDNAVWTDLSLAQTTAYFHAFMSTEQAVASGTSLALACNTERFDTATIYDTTAYAATITASGYYLFTVGLSGSAPAAAIFNVQLSGGGNVYYLAGGTMGASGDVVGGSALILATSGNVFSILVNHVTGTALTIGSAGCFFAGMKVPDV